MSSVTTPHSVTPSPAPDVTTRAIPSLDELYEWTAEPDHRVVIRGVDWNFYERLVDSIPEGAHIHCDFDGKDLEIVSPSMIHDGSRGLLGRVVGLVAEVCEIPIKSAGQTTWKRPEIARGLESDESHYFRAEKLAAVAKLRARRSMKIADYPNPDLAVEVDITPPKVDRPGIYAALKVAELWRFDGDLEQVFIERLQEVGTYRAIETSQFLPIRAEEIRRWVVEEDSSDESSWARRLRAWALAELTPRLPR